GAHGPLDQPGRAHLPALHERATAPARRRGGRPCAGRTRSGRGELTVILWHICGTPGRPLATTDSDRLSLGALTRDFVGAPSRIRTCGLLLRRQLLYPLSYRG